MNVTAFHPAAAATLYDGSMNGNNLQVNLKTTISYSGFYRVNNPSSLLLKGQDVNSANGNDGDANFQHGIVGNQFEILPVLDIRDGDYGAHFSAEGFLNTVYLQNNQNDYPASFNSIYSANNSFTDGTRNVNGQNAKLLNAFVFGQREFGGGQQVQLKFGRQTLLWGQSLFFANNGISAGQAPIDIITAQSTPNAESQQVFLPQGQIVATYRPGFSGLAFQAYYQFEWKHDTFQGAGAYFNGGDYINAGGQTVIAAQGSGFGNGNVYFLRQEDLSPERQNGQFGASVQWQLGEFDFGVYALRWDAKAPVIYATPGSPTPGAGGLVSGTYQVVYPRDIQTYGASASTNLGAANVAAEISGRRNMPLIPKGFGLNLPGNAIGNASSNPLYPVGSVFYAQASAIYLSPALPGIPGGIQFTGEVAMNHILSVDRNRDQLRPFGQSTAAAFQIVITPTYYDVFANLNVTVPIGLTYNFLGRSEVDQSMQHGTGAFNIGVTGVYKNVYTATLQYQDFLGKPSTNGENTTYNTLADRGYISLNLQYAF